MYVLEGEGGVFITNNTRLLWLFRVYPGQFLMRSICPHCCWPDWERLARWQKSFSSALMADREFEQFISIFTSQFASRVKHFFETGQDSRVYLIWRSWEKGEEDREEDIWMNINRSFKPLVILSLWSLFYGWNI